MFLLYIREKHKREKQYEQITGFLFGLKSQAEGMLNAGIKITLEDKNDLTGYYYSYVNTATHNWKTLTGHIDAMLKRLDYIKETISKESEKN